MNFAPVSLSALSSWAEWVACLIVVGMVIFAGRRRVVSAILLVVIGAAWLVGSGKGFLGPLALGGVMWILMGNLKRPWCWLGKAAALGGAAGTALLCWVFPLPESPALTGNHAVGTFAVEVPAAGSAPRLMVQVWYPAAGTGGLAPVPWLADRDLTPAFPYHWMAFAKAHARPGVPPVASGGPMPVVFYEHSWMGHRLENVAQVEALASGGFVVVAVDHSGQAERVLYPDGVVVKGRYPEPLDFSSNQQVGDFVAHSRQCFAERLANDERVRLALAGSAGGILSGRLALDRVGAFGFSFGGSAVIELCAENPAFVAGSNEDGLFLGNAFPRGPFLFFDEETPAWLEFARKPDENAGQILTREAEARIQQALKEPYRDRFILDGTRHLSFSDRIFVSRFSRLSRTGTRRASEVHEIVCRRLAVFFRMEL